MLRSPYDFFRRQTRTKLYRDLGDIVRQRQGYRTTIVLTSQIARCPYDDLPEVARSRYADSAIVVYYVYEFKRPSMFIFGYTFQSHVITNCSSHMFSLRDPYVLFVEVILKFKCQSYKSQKEYLDSLLFLSNLLSPLSNQHFIY